MKKKRWQLFLILSVIALTLYNILPTLLYYTKPLDRPIDEKKAREIELSIEKRILSLDADSTDWIRSFCRLLGVQGEKIFLGDDGLFHIRFHKTEDRKRFQEFFPKAGASILFSPAQLSLVSSEENAQKELLIRRRSSAKIEKGDFAFFTKGSKQYKEWILSRAEKIARCLLPKGHEPSFSEQGDRIDLNGAFSHLSIDWENNRFLLESLEKDPEKLLNAAAKISFDTLEKVQKSSENSFTIPLQENVNTSSFLLVNTDRIVERESQKILQKIQKLWNPSHHDLKQISFFSEEEYAKAPLEERALCAVLSKKKGKPCFDFFGIEKIQKLCDLHPDASESLSFYEDIKALFSLFSQNGFSLTPPRFSFLQTDPFLSLLEATREDFVIRKGNAFLELSTVEQRLAALNQIDTKIQEELVKWNEEYLAAKVSLDGSGYFDVPKPTKNPLWQNVVLSLKKTFRGDASKVLRWGLDLSGGKTVEVELLDPNGQKIVTEAEVKRSIDELSKKINKMGVSEVEIRNLGSHIVIDFPGSKALSAKELIKASSMRFHVVDEKFSSPSSPLFLASEEFLQEVWNEAVVTERKDALSLNEIAAQKLSGKNPSKAARKLLENGLKIDPSQKSTRKLDETLCKVALLRESFQKSHPLIFTFHNYVIEGSDLGSVQGSYDPQKGNYLNFDVLSRKGEKIYPRKGLKRWTSLFSKEKIVNTPYEKYTKGRGWRMAVLLNDSIISAPTLESVIESGASINGKFSQRELNQLIVDLKTGSLSFTPKILSEKNVSAELGQKERTQGIVATFIALFGVFFSMIIYYRLAGAIASIAVLFNLLILCAVLQNLGASLSLAGIAGIILTVGMAVDANVLVFERFKEEFRLSESFVYSINTAYKKAFSAILDSNLTTILAAVILLNFDAGPIKGFATTLIIGIASSMFSALFMTRYYFQNWGKKLSMANWIQSTSIDFLKGAKIALPLSLIIIALGLGSFLTLKTSLLGMDFTGGFSVHIETREKNSHFSLEKALQKAGLPTQSFRVQQLSPSNHLRLFLSSDLFSEKGVLRDIQSAFAEHKTPEVAWLLQTLQKHNIALTTNSLASIESSWTSMSGQMSQNMRMQAAIGLFLALLGIFFYIAIRFEYTFAIAATLCVLHDLFITLAILGISHLFGLNVQIDLHTVAALMTIMGYSLNDTIIIFDRIREELKNGAKGSFSTIVNHSLNATLSRTMITSGTTLLVLLSLVLFGGSSIFSFSYTMLIGVTLGTLSSWYIASIILTILQKKEEDLYSPKRVSIK